MLTARPAQRPFLQGLRPAIAWPIFLSRRYRRSEAIADFGVPSTGRVVSFLWSPEFPDDAVLAD